MSIGYYECRLTESTYLPVAQASFIEEDTLGVAAYKRLEFLFSYLYSLYDLFFALWFLQVEPSCPTYGSYLKHLLGLYNPPGWQTLSRQSIILLCLQLQL